MKTSGVTRAALAAGLASVAAAQSTSSPSSATACTTVLVPTYSLPVVAAGWQAQLVVSGLTKPRSLEFDSSGALLVVQSGVGLQRFTLNDNGGTCLSVNTSTTLVKQSSLNHGLALSLDGKTLYASDVNNVYAWSYDASKGTVGATPQTIVNNMGNNDLTTRTLLMSKEGTLLVSRGSSDDLTTEAETVGSGLSQIRAFALSNLTSSSSAYDFDSSGVVLGWGLRNSVGLGQHPGSGGIWSVENSVDDVKRDGVDVHESNPGEELNFHGYLNGSSAHQGGNYGYPYCFSAWNLTEIPNNGDLKVGVQFAQTDNSTMNDTVCSDDFVAPRLTFPAHEAPLDIIFSADGSTGFVSFHGSFATNHTVGYRISSFAVDKTTGEPTASSDSTTALTDIISNPNLADCPSKCFRPAGLAWDSAGRLWMTSDATGEIYVLEKTSTTSGTPTASGSGTLVTSTSAPKNDADRQGSKMGLVAAGVVAAALALL